MTLEDEAACFRPGCRGRGIFNVASEPGYTTTGGPHEAVKSATGSATRLAWVAPGLTKAADIAPWPGLPMWVRALAHPGSGENPLRRVTARTTGVPDTALARQFACFDQAHSSGSRNALCVLRTYRAHRSVSGPAWSMGQFDRR
jgi:hypothetical protein